MQVDDPEFTFGPYRLVVLARLLLRDGVPVALGARAFDLLTVLVEGRGETIAREALLRRVWPEGGMHANNLGVQISALRRALAVTGTEDAYIATVPGRGIRFVAPVTLEASRIGAGLAAAGRKPARGNLPVQTTRLIGRADEVTAVVDALTRWPLVTLVGSSGIGKTRIAYAAASEAQFADGAWLIDLAQLTEPAALATAVATAMGLPIGAGEVTVANVAGQLRRRAALLVFDNCEHLRDAAAAMATAILALCPAVRILATSHAPLEIARERVDRIEPLAVPRDGQIVSARDLFDFAACTLFIERAKATDGSFAATDANAATIAEICRRLDGLPLAIELAASRHFTLGLSQIRRGLDDRFRLLVGGERFGASPRHASLGAALDWSYALLTPHEQTALRRLGVLIGAFDLDAAAAVADASADEISALVERSLVTVEQREPEPRYRMLESTRAFAAERLAEAGERDEADRAHAGYFKDLFEAAERDWETGPTGFWQAGLLPDFGNLRAALAWSFGTAGDRRIGQTLCAASLRFWHGFGLMAEYRRWLDRALAGPVADDRLAARLWMANARSVLSVATRLEEAGRAEILARACDDRETLGRALAIKGDALRRTGDWPGAEAALSEASALLRSSGAAKSCADAIQQLAIIRHHRGDVTGSRALNADALVRYRSTGHDVGIIACLVRQANDDMAAERIVEAIAATNEAIALSRAIGNRYMLELTLGNLASYEARRLGWRAAWQAATEALPFAIDLDDRAGVATIVETLAAIAARHGQHEAAACLLGYSEAFYALDGEAREPTDQGAYERLVAELVGALDGEALAMCRGIGAKWTDDIILAAVGQLRLFDSGSDAD
jgi:predicted ATPase/DNA-binding winged helix-turn-helix (wHTH) protein